MPKKNESTVQAEQIIAYLNEKAGRKFRMVPSHKEFIRRRLKEGYELEDFKTVIDNKVRDWANDPYMYTFLRPETLFGNKFDGYLNLPPPPKEKVEKTSFQKKRATGDSWLKRSNENDKRAISEGTKDILELRGSEPGRGNFGGLVSDDP